MGLAYLSDGLSSFLHISCPAESSKYHGVQLGELLGELYQYTEIQYVTHQKVPYVGQDYFFRYCSK